MLEGNIKGSDEIQNVIGTYCGILVIVDFNCLYRVNSHISEEFLNGITL